MSSYTYIIYIHTHTHMYIWILLEIQSPGYNESAFPQLAQPLKVSEFEVPPPTSAFEPLCITGGCRGKLGSDLCPDSVSGFWRK